MTNLKRSADGEPDAIKMMQKVFTEKGKILSVTFENGKWKGHGMENASFHILILDIMKLEDVRGWFKFFCFGQVGREAQGRLTYIYTADPRD